MSDGKFKFELEFDHDELRNIVREKFAPAIETVLVGVDVEKMIRDKLIKPPRSLLQGMYFGFDHPTTILDELILGTIRDEAKAFVEKSFCDNRSSIEAAFIAMMRSSEKKLSNAFCEAVLNADWHFNLAAEIEAPTKDASDD